MNASFRRFSLLSLFLQLLECGTPESIGIGRRRRGATDRIPAKRTANETAHARLLSIITSRICERACSIFEICRSFVCSSFRFSSDTHMTAGTRGNLSHTTSIKERRGGIQRNWRRTLMQTDTDVRGCANLRVFFFSCSFFVFFLSFCSFSFSRCRSCRGTRRTMSTSVSSETSTRPK